MSEQLPNGWVSVKFDEVIDVLDFEREPINSSERALRIEGKNNSALFPYFGATGQVGWIDSFRSEGERILLGEDAAPFLDPVKDKAYLANGRFWVNNHAHVLRGASGLVNNRYLCHQLNNVDYHSFVSGSTRLKLTSGSMKQIPMAIAPAAEQTRIVEKLEELLSDLDAGVAELKAAQAKLARYRQSLLKAAVEGALTAEWRAARAGAHPPPRAGEVRGGGAVPPSQPSPARGGRGQSDSGAQLLQRILSERRARWEAKQLAKFAEQGKAPAKDWQQKYPEPVQPDIAHLPELPDGWVWASGEQLCKFITKGTTPPKNQDTGKNRPIPFLRVTNLTENGDLDLADKVFITEKTHRGFLARSVVYPNDVLMNIVGPPLGQVALVPKTFAEWNINQAIAIFRAADGVSPIFVCQYLLSPIAQQWLKARSKTTAGQTNLTLEVCRSLPIPLPPQEEQEALLIKINTALDATSRQTDAIKLSLKQSTVQRKNILRAAFSGQLVPQDPNDEPASALLARILKERAKNASTTLRRRRRADAGE